VTSARGRARAWAELLRISALFTVPGDVLAGAAATRTAPNRATALAVGASLCLYEAGMALNDWADRDIDAIERPRRPLPSGRITPAAALTAATALTGAGLACAALAGRRTLATAAALAGTVWAYDLGLKNTPAGPYAMATARSLDLLLGATATHAPAARQALPPAALLGAHTLAVTAVSRHEATGGSSKAPLTALATSAAIAWTATRPTEHAAPTPSHHQAPTTEPGPSTTSHGLSADRPALRGPGAALTPTTSPNRTRAAALAGAAGRPRPSRTLALARRAAARMTSRPSAPLGGLSASRPALRGLAEAAIHTASPGRGPATAPRPGAGLPADRRAGGAAMRVAARARPRARGTLTAGPAPRPLAPAALAAAYLATAARPLAHAALNPSPYLLQRAVGGGIRAMIPLQAALAARAGAGRTGVGLLVLMPVARRLSRKVSPT
jgi:4-hydroxybenzoate polyprenyltransferase